MAQIQTFQQYSTKLVMESPPFLDHLVEDCLQLSKAEWIAFKDKIDYERKMKEGEALYQEYEKRSGKTAYLHAMEEDSFDTLKFFVTEKDMKKDIRLIKFMDKKRKRIPFEACFPN